MSDSYAGWAAVTMAVWANAALAGAVDPDTAADRICEAGGGVPSYQRVTGLPGFVDHVSLPVALNVLRRSGARHATLALPVPGDPLGLAGPSAFNSDAIAAGQAVVIPEAHLGLVPTIAGETLVWWVQAAEPPGHGIPDLAEADRGLREGIVTAAEHLERLNAPGVAPDLVDVLIEAPPAERITLPTAYPARARGLLERAVRIAWATDLGRADDAGRDGGAITGTAAEARQRLLSTLNSAARSAVVAAAGLQLR